MNDLLKVTGKWYYNCQSIDGRVRCISCETLANGTVVCFCYDSIRSTHYHQYFKTINIMLLEFPKESEDEIIPK